MNTGISYLAMALDLDSGDVVEIITGDQDGSFGNYMNYGTLNEEEIRLILSHVVAADISDRAKVAARAIHELMAAEKVDGTTLPSYATFKGGDGAYIDEECDIIGIAYGTWDPDNAWVAPSVKVWRGSRGRIHSLYEGWE